MPAYAHLFWISQFKNICFKKLFKILSMQCWHLLWKCFHLDTVQTKQHSTLNGSPVYFLIYAIIQATRILLYGSIIISQQCNTQNHRHCSKVSGCGKCVFTNFAIVVCTNWSEQQSLQIMVQAKKIKIIANTVSGNALFFPKKIPQFNHAMSLLSQSPIKMTITNQGGYRLSLASPETHKNSKLHLFLMLLTQCLQCCNTQRGKHYLAPTTCMTTPALMIG